MADLLRCYTPPQLAARYGVKPSKVRTWITRGELAAVDVSTTPGIGRPLWRITPEALIAFEQRRAARQPVKQSRKVRRDDHVIQFIK